MLHFKEYSLRKLSLLLRCCGVPFLLPRILIHMYAVDTWADTIELCSYSGYKIYPGHGKRMVKTDGRVFQFLNGKCEASHLMKRNPREISWTVLYRRKHKKGQTEEVSKKRTRRTQKFTRAITGASLTDILAKRNQKPEVRKAQREQAIRAAKEKQKAKDAQKKAQKVSQPKQQKAPKMAQKGGTKPRVGGKR
ncbi:hypothetical protein FSP39_008851 [Pinctada imbricata]|uniref:Large ribosomal subunit protein eL24 n=1 Tax=Pinctada imbricata TaxID=66713 RepID=A0AA89C0A2_PINIB|nr:hypothetical protein FSP39_008851 [Pinctada imbricata]